VSNETIESEAVYFPITSDEQAVDAAGGYASVEGEAVHDPGAAVRVNDAFTVGVPEVETWPDDVLGKQVRVKGRLQSAEGGYVMERILYEVESD
jgi:hypothetical protein